MLLDFFASLINTPKSVLDCYKQISMFVYSDHAVKPLHVAGQGNRDVLQLIGATFWKVNKESNPCFVKFWDG